VLGIGAAMASVLAVVVHRRIAHPIDELAQAVQELSDGHYDPAWLRRRRRSRPVSLAT
jgi:HAMP domain-containing protein